MYVQHRRNDGVTVSFTFRLRYSLLMAIVIESIGFQSAALTIQDQVATIHVLYCRDRAWLVRNSDYRDRNDFVALLSTSKQLLDECLQLGFLPHCVWFLNLQPSILNKRICWESSRINRTSNKIYYRIKELKKVQKMRQCFKRALIFFFSVIQAQRESGRWKKKLLGDNTGSCFIMLQLVRFHCDGVWISTGLPCRYIYIYVYTYIHA